MAETVKRKFSLISVFAPGLKRFKDFLDGAENGIVDSEIVKECEGYIEAMKYGQYDKGDIIIGNEYIQDLRNVQDRASSNGGGRKKQVKQIKPVKDGRDNERA